MKKMVIDAHAICYMSKYAMGNLTWEERQVGTIFGFFKQLLALSKQFATNEFLFTWDSRSNLRKKIFPEYKGNRHRDKTQEEIKLDALFYDQIFLLREDLLPAIGFKNNYLQEGYESDDLIAVLARDVKDPLIIVSTDNDLFQLLRTGVEIYSPASKKITTEKSFIDHYKIPPNKWVEVKAIGGCSSDNVPGVPGVGEVTAIRYLKKELLPHHKPYQAIVSTQGKEIIDRNRLLVALPMEGAEKLSLQPNQWNVGEFLRICSRFGFRSFLKNENYRQWMENIFEKKS